MRVNSINILRLCAIFTIFLSHSNDFLPERLGDYTAVLTGYSLQLFFIVSGFCCVLSAWKKNPKTGPYLLGRLRKIYPMHLIGYGLMAYLTIYQVRIGWLDMTKMEFVRESIVNMLLLQSWTPDEALVYSFNGPSWFLSSLLFCYLLTPVFTRLLKRGKNYAWWGVVAFLAIQTAYKGIFDYLGLPGWFCYTNVFPPYRFLEFAMGGCMAAAYIVRREQGPLPRNSAIQIGTIVLFFGVFYGLTNARGMQPTDLFIVFTLFLVYGLCFVDGIITDISSNKVLERMANEIMPFYLLHSIVLKYIRYFYYNPVQFDDPALCIALVVGTFIFCVVMSRLYYIVEGQIKKAWRNRSSKLEQ